MAGPEDEEFLRGAFDAYRAGGVATSAPPVPPPDDPGVRDAEARFLRQAIERFELRQPGPEGQAAASAVATKLRDRPAPIAELPTLLEQAALSVARKGIRKDARPERLADVPDYLRKQYKEEVVSTVDPFGVFRSLGAFSSDPDIGGDLEGLPLENSALWAMRVIFSAAPALVVETVKRAPAPSVSDAARAAREGAFADAATRFLRPSTLGEEVLGWDPVEGQRVQRTNAAANWAQGVLEKVERGDGFETDLALTARERLGEEWERTGWWIGLGIDTITNWEGALANTATALPKLVARARAVSEVAPALGKLERFMTALRGGELDLAAMVGEPVAVRVERGELALEDLSADLRASLDEVSLREFDMTADELLEEAGIVARPRPGDPAYQAMRAELEAAQSGIPKEMVQPLPTRIRGKERTAAVEKRPLLPEVSGHKQPRTATEVWDWIRGMYARGDAPKRGWSIPRGLLAKRIYGIEDQTIDTPNYILRNGNGDVIRTGTFEEVTEALRRKPRLDDEVWYGNVRRVAYWRKTADVPAVKQGDRAAGPPKSTLLTADRNFATDTERALVRVMRQTDPRAIPARIQQRVAARGDEVADAVHKALAQVVTRAPAGPKPETDLGRAVVEAMRLTMARKMDASRFHQLPNGAFVPKPELKRLRRALDEVAGMRPARVQQLIGGAKPTAAETARIAALGQRYGVDVSAGLTVPTWQSIRNAILRDVGGVLADTRYRVQGTASFVDRVWGAVSDLHLDRRRVGAVRRYLRRSVVGKLTEALLDDKIGQLPVAVRTRLKELRVALERNLDDMIIDYRAAAAAGGTRTERLLAMLGQYNVVAPRHVALANDMVAKPTRQLVDDLIALLPKRPRWADFKDYAVRADNAMRWARQVRDDAAVQGREWVRSVLLTRGDEVSGTLDGQLIDRLDRDLALRVYDEVFGRGELLGEGTQAALTALRVVQGGWDETQALITHAIRMRSDGIIDRAMHEMLAEGLVVRATDPRGAAMAAVLKGTHRVWDEAGKRWDYLFPEAQITWALERLRDWGIEPGADAAMRVGKIGRREVAVPEYLARDIERLVKSAQIDSRTVWDSRLIDDLTRLTKEWTTHGVIIPNPPYFMGQMLGVWPTLYTTRGLSGTAQVAGQLLLHPLETSEIMRRLAQGPLFAKRTASTFVTDAGDVLSYDLLEAAGRRMGLQDTPASFESAQRFRELVTADGPDTRWLDWRKLQRTYQWWQQTIREWAGTFDYAARIAAFVADAKRGIPLDQAAQNAREQLLDYRALTEVEAVWGRRMFMFYAFMRKNSDAYIKALVKHPGRVGAQMRLAHASLTESGLSELELASMREEDMARLVLYDDDQVVNDAGRVHPRYRMNRLTSTPMGVVEAMLTLKMFLGQDMPKLLGSFNPALQSFALLTQGRKLDREASSAASNRMPPWLIEFPGLGPWVRSTFGVGPMPLQGYEDPMLADDDATLEIGSGVPAVWAAGGDPTLTPEQRQSARRSWQMFRSWLGRPLSTGEDISQLIGWQEVDPNLTWSEHALATALGLRWLPVVNEQEAIRRQLLQRANRLDDAAVELRVPR